MKKNLFSTLILLFLTSILPAEEAGYTNSSIARLSYITGSAHVQRTFKMEFEEAVINMPITEGDRVGTSNGRVEIHFSRGKYLRLDKNTKIDILKLPDRASDLIQIRIWAGSCYLRVNKLESEKNIEIHTSDVSIYTLDKGLYRVDVRENQETEFFVFKGLLEAAMENGSVLVKEEQRLEVIDGQSTSSPTLFRLGIEDSFDRWNGMRDLSMKKKGEDNRLPEELEDFETELDAYGEWATEPEYGSIWIPGDIAPDWHPYYYGRWTWLPLSGWTWIPDEPWGWVAFHYGRWHWSPGRGWYWIPTGVWGPGWVEWYWGSDYWGWVPLSYYDRPGVIIDNVYYARYQGSSFPNDSPTLTVIHKNQLAKKNVSKVALSRDAKSRLGKISITSEQPPVKPETGNSIKTVKKGLSGSMLPAGIRTLPSREVQKVRTAQNVGSRRILRSPVYPSSPDIRSGRRSGKRGAVKSSAVPGRLYDYISETRSRALTGSPSRIPGKETPTRSMSSSSAREPGKPKSMRARSQGSTGASTKGSVSSKKIKK